MSILALILTLTLSPGTARAEPAAAPEITMPLPSGPAAPFSARSKKLDFDDEMIEGMNRNPLDSLTRVGKNDLRNHDRLYRRKQNFKREIRQTTREMGYSQ
jgi:hypothetical protein